MGEIECSFPSNFINFKLPADKGNIQRNFVLELKIMVLAIYSHRASLTPFFAKFIISTLSKALRIGLKKRELLQIRQIIRNKRFNEHQNQTYHKQS